MIYSTEVQNMCPVAKGAYHGPAPIPEEGKWVAAKQITDISGLTHGIGWCAPQQGAVSARFRWIRIWRRRVGNKKCGAHRVSNDAALDGVLSVFGVVCASVD